jgi:beta-N-acetylglucosaminidase/Glycosyl hydrolase family 20, domain 2
MNKKMFTALTVLLSALTIFAKTTIVIPQPKEEKYSESRFFIVKENKAAVVIADGNKSISALDLIKAIKKLSGVTLKFAESDKNQSLIIMDIGGRHPAVHELKVDIPAQAEGYAIKSGKWHGKEVLVLAGRDKAGLYWSLQTLRQLLQKRADSLFVPQCSIRDWPDLQFRSMGDGTVLETVKNQMAYKVNTHFYMAFGKYNFWKNPPKKLDQQLAKVMSYANPRNSKINVMVCPYFLPTEKLKGGNIVVSNPKDLNIYYNTLKKLALDHGNLMINVEIDDPGYHPELCPPQDKKKFGSFEAAHAALIAYISKRAQKEFPGTMVNTVPGHYHDARDVKDLYDKFGVPKDVAVMWTGEKTVTYNIKPETVKELEKGLQGRKFIFFDNTVGQPEGHTTGPILLEDDYGAGFAAAVNSPKCLGWHVMSSIGRNPMRIVHNMQVADFMWNAKNYDSQKSMRRVISKVVGINSLPDLMEYKKNMVKLVGYLPYPRSNTARSNLSQEESKQANILLANAGFALERACQKAKPNALGKAYLNDLRKLYGKAKKMFEESDKQKSSGKLIKPSGNVAFETKKDIIGGKFFRSYAWKCPPRNNMVAFYGEGQKKEKGVDKGFINFSLNKLPAKNATLVLEGQATNGTPYSIVLNGKAIFSGKKHFPYAKWGQQKITIDKNIFKKGINKLEFIRTNGGGWVALVKVSIEF